MCVNDDFPPYHVDRSVPDLSKTDLILLPHVPDLSKTDLILFPRVPEFPLCCQMALLKNLYISCSQP